VDHCKCSTFILISSAWTTHVHNADIGICCQQSQYVNDGGDASMLNFPFLFMQWMHAWIAPPSSSPAVASMASPSVTTWSRASLNLFLSQHIYGTVKVSKNMCAASISSIRSSIIHMSAAVDQKPCATRLVRQQSSLDRSPGVAGSAIVTCQKFRCERSKI